jgi:hypothetical protein
MKNTAVVFFKKNFEERILPLRYAQGQDDEFRQNEGLIPRQAGWLAGLPRASPRRRGVVLQEFSPHVFPRVEPVENRVHNAGGAVHDVEGRFKSEFIFFP